MGGAVRDQLLGLPIRERDWVVVGGTPEALLQAGYKPVGKDFPVFLHPRTHEEYALARTERKTAKGYKGFSFYTSPEVTLEEDLARRDLTINAIAQNTEGMLIDPYHGQQDLKNKILRHVSAAFQEDPVRILRSARFAAKFSDFTIHPETLALMKAMVKAGEVDALVSERVWQELARALAETHPARFFETLQECGALNLLFPTLDLETLRKAAEKTSHPLVRWATLVHALTPEALSQLVSRYRVPNEYSELAALVIRFSENYRDLQLEDKATVLDLLLSTDALRRPERFEAFLESCAILHPKCKEHSVQLRQSLARIKQVGTQDLQAQHLRGEDFSKKLREKRLKALE